MNKRGGVSGFLVTGGAGFIASHLADALLAAGHKVRVLDDFSTGHPENLDPRCEVVAGDVADPATVRAALAGLDGCFHLAAVASVAAANADWLGTHRVNLTGTITVLDAARAARLPVVYASSAAIYGDLGGRVAAETLPASPLTAYGADKLAAELHAAVAWRVHRVPTLGLRLFNIYGPRQDPGSPYSGVVSLFAARLLAGAALSIDGDGTQTRDFVFVADAVAHFRAAMQRLLAGGDGGEVLNVCTGQDISVLELARTLAGLCGLSPKLSHGPARAGDIGRSVGDPSAAAARLGLRATTSLPDGLAATLAWLRSLQGRK